MKLNLSSYNGNFDMWTYITLFSEDDQIFLVKANFDTAERSKAQSFPSLQTLPLPVRYLKTLVPMCRNMLHSFVWEQAWFSDML